ncbi:MAG: thioredoxin family protein [Candidatus Methanoperedens sp.]|nr:thioredoxin family protein [Candidatus Methanoperedens sp.]
MIKRTLLLLVLLVLLSGCLDINPKLNYLDEPEEVDTGTLTLHRLTFGTDLAQALESATAQDKPVFTYFRSEYCGWCKKFEEETFTNNTVVAKLNENFILVSLDVNTQKNETRGFRVRGTPASVFLYPNGTEISRIPGYTDTESFLTIINKIR